MGPDDLGRGNRAAQELGVRALQHVALRFARDILDGHSALPQTEVDRAVVKGGGIEASGEDIVCLLEDLRQIYLEPEREVGDGRSLLDLLLHRLQARDELGNEWSEAGA